MIPAREELIHRMERVELTTKATPPATAASLTQMVKTMLPAIEDEAVEVAFLLAGKKRPDPARYLDLDSPATETRLAKALAKSEWCLVRDMYDCPDPQHYHGHEATTIIQALRNPTADEG